MNEQKLRDILYNRSEEELLRDELRKIFLIANKTMDCKSDILSYHPNDNRFYIKNRHGEIWNPVDDNIMKNSQFRVLHDVEDKFILIGLSEIKKIMEIFDSILKKLEVQNHES